MLFCDKNERQPLCQRRNTNIERRWLWWNQEEAPMSQCKSQVSGGYKLVFTIYSHSDLLLATYFSKFRAKTKQSPTWTSLPNHQQPAIRNPPLGIETALSCAGIESALHLADVIATPKSKPCEVVPPVAAICRAPFSPNLPTMKLK